MEKSKGNRLRGFGALGNGKNRRSDAYGKKDSTEKRAGVYGRWFYWEGC